MSAQSVFRLTLVSISVLGLSACSILDRNSAQRKAEEALEKEGRITMVLGDERLQPDPDLVTEIVTLPPARDLADGWPQAGSRASKAIGHISAASEFDVAWRANVGSGSDRSSALTTPPVASADTIYTIDSRQVITATDAANGSRVWSEKLDSGSRRDNLGIGSGIGLEGNTLVIASAYGFVAAMDASNGNELWRTETEAPMTGSPTIKDGRIFVSSNNNEVLALDLATGDVIWSDQAIAESARVLGSPSPAAVEDIVVAPYSSGEVIAYLASNGRRLWAEALASVGQFTPISSINDIGARPILGGGLVFAASQSGVFAAIDGRTGNRVWQQPIGTTQAPALTGEYLFIMGVDAELACIKAGTGQVVWVKDLEKFSNEKKQKGRLTYAGPVIASGRVLVVSSKGELIAFDPQTGDETDRLKIGDPVYIEPIAVQEKLIVLTDDARLVAVR
ncbi:MAG: PQQ-binding-like beta-propeller repeat protein [Henriciella sp.]|nr:PQQ-binding-like beta-propeller repeat protein [Henriciella sp.]